MSWFRRQKSALPRAIVAVAVVTLAGCGSTSHIVGHTNNPGANPAATPAPPGSNVHDQAAAQAEAARVLKQLAPPVGAKPLNPPPQQLATPPEKAPTQNAGLAAATWSSTASPQAVLQAVNSSKLPGYSNQTTTSFGANGGANQGLQYASFVNANNGSLAPGTTYFVSVMPTPTGSDVRYDVQVTWSQARPANTLVPASDTVAIVSVTGAPQDLPPPQPSPGGAGGIQPLSPGGVNPGGVNQGPSHGPVTPIAGGSNNTSGGPVTTAPPSNKTVTITDPTKVQGLREAVNALSEALPIQVNCPEEPATVQHLSFATAPGQKPTIDFTMAGCAGIQESVNGHQVATLAYNQAYNQGIQGAIGQAASYRHGRMHHGKMNEPGCSPPAMIHRHH